ncbi:MAG TPA: HypC/HybG/HupF family hydrogenase formation chaperone [Phycisphaerae bacterium]|nr:HypC/HybG/HupF family hydrogenase formation chaperone [Phycisphaerales bacterium]HNO79079.1 HypC/HybG/HupF family hydrogenase formation chaperone [Phycisphaerae bacterium]
MCLAVPGKLIDVTNSPDMADGLASGTVDFQGTRIKANLIFTPEAREGDWVLVHAGFAIQKLTEAEALETWKYLDVGEIEEELPAAEPFR